VALLIVQARAEDGILAAPGNRTTCNIPVSVTDSAGIPIAGLAAANFKVDAMLVGPGGAQVVMVDTQPVRLPGTYNLKVEPIPGQTWKAGVYVFAVAVTRGDDRGQALCNPMLMD
jgi:hypothetical protein